MDPSETFNVTIDKKNYSISEIVDLDIMITNANYKDLDFPLETPDYKVIAQSSSSNIRIINAAMSQERAVHLKLALKRTGTIIIPAVRINIAGKPYVSQPITIEVTENANPSANNTASQTRNTTAAAQKQQLTKDQMFVQTSVSKTTAYRNEQITLKIKFYHIGNARSINSPVLELNNFIQEAVDEALEYKEQINGVNYFVYELDYVLFPIKSGSITIPAVEIKGSAVELHTDPRDPFSVFGRPFDINRAFQVKSNPITLTVKELPAKAPPGFSGYVGDLHVSHQLDTTEALESEALTLSSSIYGNGSLSFLDLDFIDESNQYNTFKDKTSENSEIESRVKYSRLNTKTAIVPNKTGKIKLKINPIISFNPILNRYEEHGDQEFNLKISPDPNKEDVDPNYPLTNKKSSQGNNIKKEILTISQTQILKYKQFSIAFQYMLYILLLLNSLAALVYLFKKFKGQQSNNEANAKQTKVKLSKLEKSIRSSDSTVSLSITMRDFHSKLEQQGLLTKSAELRSQFEKFLNQCDSANYGQADISLDELQDEAVYLIKLAKNNGRK